MQPDYRVPATDETINFDWDADRASVLTIESGDVVEFECVDVTNGQLDEDSTVEDALNKEFKGHPITGPVRIPSAEAGDVLEVELLDLRHQGVGFTYQYGDGGGILPEEEMPDPELYVWDLDDEVGHFVDGIRVPLNPFPGTIGVAPAEPGTHSTSPPRSVGGNMDIKHLRAGSTVYLPVEVDGALFSVGDCHAAQGDGEVGYTGIEAAMSVDARFRVRSDMDITQPQFETTGPFTATGSDEPTYGTAGIGSSLLEASQNAIRQMVSHLETTHGLSRTHAYVLCSVAIDLKINELVNWGSYCVSAYLPESIFPD